MDIRRTVIFIGLAISSYFLILAWNDDYGQKTQSQATTAESTVITPDLPDTTDAALPASSDAPQVAGSEPVVAQASGELIRVETDVLKLVIDPRGGEVAEVKLPAYPVAVDQMMAISDANRIMRCTAAKQLLTNWKRVRMN